MPAWAAATSGCGMSLAPQAQAVVDYPSPLVPQPLARLVTGLAGGGNGLALHRRGRQDEGHDTHRDQEGSAQQVTPGERLTLPGGGVARHAIGRRAYLAFAVDWLDLGPSR